MSPFSEVRTSCAPPPPPTGAEQAIRWLCTNNPFYAISAGLFLAGLWISFGDPRQGEDTWAFMSGLTGYTLLLAGTALLLVRFARVWDDARTVLLLVVLMFLATSVTFDNVLVADVLAHKPARGIACFLLGLMFAVAVSEGLLRGIRLALPALFRVPYYLILSLFFIYPLALIPMLQQNEPRHEAIMWGLFAFSSIAGLMFLTLLPAIRRGPEYVRGNGSPWPWPLYPWSLFGLLAAAVPARAVLMCFSMHLIGIRDLYESIFGLYFLVPFGLALAVLLLEMGLVSRHAGVLWTALSIPAGLVVLSLVGHRAEPIYETFLRIFTQRLGASPAYLALVGAASFYAYAAVRRVPRAAEVMTAALVLLAVSGSRSVRLEGFAPFQQLPLLAAAVVQLGMGAWERASWRCLLGSMAAVGSITLPADAATFSLRFLIAYHLALFAVLVVGGIFADDVGRALRVVGTGMAFSACLVTTFVPLEPPLGLPGWAMSVYPFALALLLAGYGVWLRHIPALVCAALVLTFWLAGSSWHVYAWCRQVVVGLDYLVVSLALFIVALVISLGKSGLLPAWCTPWRREKAPQSLE